MDTTVMLNGKFLLLFVTWLAVVSHRRTEALKCYQCQVESNELCTEDLMTECPSDQAYDRCLTRVLYSKSSGHLISKQCALAPCNLRDPTAITGLGLNHCDRSKTEYDCVACCLTDGCNTDGASVPHSVGVAFCITIAFLCTRINI